jgi:hypothetical protein
MSIAAPRSRPADALFNCGIVRSCFSARFAYGLFNCAKWSSCFRAACPSVTKTPTASPDCGATSPSWTRWRRRRSQRASQLSA